MKKIIILIITFLILSVNTVLWSRTSEIVDTAVAQQQIECGTAALLLLTAAEEIEDGADSSEAWKELCDFSWFSSSKMAKDEIRLGEYAHALMQLFELKGGVMYTLFPSPRYASRELGYLGIILHDAGAYRSLSGIEAVSILRSVMQLQ